MPDFWVSLILMLENALFCFRQCCDFQKFTPHPPTQHSVRTSFVHTSLFGASCVLFELIAYLQLELILKVLV